MNGSAAYGAGKRYTDEHGGGKAGNYDELINQPQINNKTLKGNKSADDLDLIQKSLFLNKLYPTGFVLSSYENINPKTYIGGEWELVDYDSYVVEAKRDGFKYYIVYSNGLVIQGGRDSISECNTKTITLPVSMKDANYTLQVLNNCTHTAKDAEGTLTGVIVSATQIKVCAGYINPNSTNFFWQVVGMSSKEVKPTLYKWKRTDSGILASNFLNLSFSDTDFKVDDNGKISLKNTQYAYAPNKIVSGNESGVLTSTDIDLTDIVMKTRKIAGIDLKDDIEADEIQESIKDISATLKNKSINADDNTITNIETDNLKSSSIATSISDKPSEKKVATEKAVSDYGETIKEIISGIAPKAITPTVDSSIVSANTNSCFQIGNLVILNLNMKFASNDTGNILTNLPAAKDEAWGILVNGTSAIEIKIESAGTVLLKQTAAGSGGWFKGTLVYFVG